MKKGIVILLVALALIVLISPGIVGRLAEKSVEEQLDWAATENQEIKISALRFDRGWFSSEGQHRIELGDNAAGERLRTQLGLAAGEATPALIIDTRIDHGLIPVSSMSREKGSLAPGLGSAVSTVHIEAGDGSRTELPGKVYSSVGLNGALTSQYSLEPGSLGGASWGNTDIKATTDARNRGSEVEGSVVSFAFAQDEQQMQIGDLSFVGDMQMTDYGYAVGDLQMSIADMRVITEGAPAVNMGPIEIDAQSGLADDRVDSDMRMQMAMGNLPGVGEVSWALDLSVTGVDARAMGAVVAKLETMPESEDPSMLFAYAEQDFIDLFAGGFNVTFKQLDVTLPAGTMKMKYNFDVPASDRDDFAWTSLLLDLEADADIEIPEALYQMAVAMNPGANAAVGMGFLKKNGDVYEMQATYKKGLLTVNGAPMPIPLPGLQ